VEPAADSAATVQEAGWALVDSAWVVMVDPALVRFRVMSSKIETSLADIYNIFQRADINIERFFGSARNDKLLQPLAVNLINANEAPNEIPIFLVRKTASARGPDKLTRRFWVVRIVNEIAFNSGIRRKRLLLIN
jgi:hypothetical protein